MTTGTDQPDPALHARTGRRAASSRTWRRIAASLSIASAALFAIGAQAEGDRHAEGAEARSVEADSDAHVGEGEEGHAESETEEHHEDCSEEDRKQTPTSGCSTRRSRLPRTVRSPQPQQPSTAAGGPRPSPVVITMARVSR